MCGGYSTVSGSVFLAHGSADPTAAGPADSSYQGQLGQSALPDLSCCFLSPGFYSIWEIVFDIK